MMDDATQKLVDEARRQARILIRTGHGIEGRTLYERLADALEAAQRPPVSPEQRDELASTIAVHRRGVGARPHRLGVELTDALLARFSLPVLDAEKVARFLYSLDPAIQGWNGDPYAYNEPNAKRHRDRAQQWAERLIEALPTLTANTDKEEENRDRA